MQVLLLFSSVNRSTSPGHVFHPSISGGFFNEIEPPAEARCRLQVEVVML